MLFKTTAEVKAFANNLSANLTFASIAPAIADAEELYIIKAIGQELYETLEAQYQANTLSAKNALLLPLIRKPLANYALYLDMLTRNGLVTDAGVMESTAQSVQQARQWVQVQSQLTHWWKGEHFLDAALVYMESQKGTANAYDLWELSDEYTLYKENFFSSCREFEEFKFIDGSRSTFKALRPYIEQAEYIHIRPAMGDAQFETLKTKYKANTLTTQEIKLLKYIRRALAEWAVYEGVAELNVTLVAGGFKSITQNDGLTQKILAPREEIALLRDNARNKGAMFTADMKKFMDTTASETVFPDYFTSEKLKNERPKTTIRKNASGSKSIML